MQDPYKILGISQTASGEDVNAAYKKLMKRYNCVKLNKIFPPAVTSKMIREADEARYEILSGLETADCGAGTAYRLARARRLINKGTLWAVEEILGKIPEGERDDEWHYLMALYCYKSESFSRSLKHGEIACLIEPNNFEYKKLLKSAKAESNVIRRRKNPANIGEFLLDIGSEAVKLAGFTKEIVLEMLGF